MGSPPGMRWTGAGAWMTPSSQRRQAYFGRIVTTIDASLEVVTKLSAKRLFDEIRAAGYAGRYSRVSDYVRSARPRESVEPIIRFETPAGWQGQVDFGTFTLPWGRRHALVVVLGYWRGCTVLAVCRTLGSDFDYERFGCGLSAARSRLDETARMGLRRSLERRFPALAGCVDASASRRRARNAVTTPSTA